MTSLEWRPLARALAERLAAAGVLDPTWYHAFADTPRHVFVPRFLDGDTLIEGADPAQRQRWLAEVYADTSLVTQQAVAPGTDLPWPTSSSTMPSLMARMLGLLEVADGHRVLEVGTGTGYHAAVLCHRLGDASVASIDIDPVLVADARDRLADLGHRPHLAVGDGAAGIGDHAPFDRLIATCAVSCIPPAWITQLAPGGVLVTDLRGEVSSALLVARRTAPDTVTGRFQATPGHFMWLRASADNPLRDGGTLPTTMRLGEPQTSATSIDPDLFDDPDLRFLIQLHVPGLKYVYRADEHGRAVVRLATATDGWADLDTTTSPAGEHVVTHGGPDQLWETVERVVDLWTQLGRPSRERFGLTAHTDGNHTVWLDNAGTPLTPLGVHGAGK